MVARIDVEFPGEGNVQLSAWLYVPDSAGPHPAITMAHGYGGTRDHGIEPFAKAFASAGFAVLLHDHRGFGRSGGEPRQDIDPWQQIADWRRAISYLETRPEVDPTRIGVWGTSYAGGHAIVLGATDRRLRCVVAQVPTISGHEQFLRRINPDAFPAFDEMLAQEDRSRLRGDPLLYQALVSDDISVAASYRSTEAIEFYTQPIPAGIWENKVTIRSTRSARMYEPGVWISRIAPTPLLMVVASQDKVTLTEIELAAYERALEPKNLP
ncbi:alpha/beta fold hydrolase [Rhizobium sp. AN63]|uniref:alpha/beta hydrolase n=1 Tax=Rhizobium sp. AN63 TaxID=3035210 RepID=UPI0027D4413A|nr:alpha/beta fold hydrolase [Rhizobium sp. AN63]MDQ4408747.1 alpha/beta fold hydrolase [Rhizobium sp. AN63]